MDTKYPRRNTGLHGSITGTIKGKVLSKTVKNGTVPMLGMNVVYEEYDGSTSFCRVTLFGNQAQAIDGKLETGQTVTAEGTVRLNSWDKNGETMHGLSMLASRLKVEDDSGNGSAGGCQTYAGSNGSRTKPGRVSPPADDANPPDVF